MQSFFRHFPASEFFNSHRPYRNFAPFVRQTGERKAQACAKGMLRQLCPWVSLGELPPSQGLNNAA
jgi:hypothetical protein